MRVKTKIVTNLHDTTSCASDWFKTAIGKETSSWHDNRFSYVSTLVCQSLSSFNWLTKISELSLLLSKNDRSRKKMAEIVEFIGLSHNHGSSCNSLVTQVISFLLLHLSFQGHIKLRYGHHICLPKRPETFDWFYRRGLIVDSLSHLYMASTPDRFSYFRSSLPQKYHSFLDSLASNHRSTRQRVSMNMIEAATYSRIKSLDDMSSEVLAIYYKANSEASEYYISIGDQTNRASTVTYSLFMDMLDAANNTRIRKEYESLLSQRLLSQKAKSVDSIRDKHFINTLSTPSAIKNCTCNSLNFQNYEIDTKIREVKVLSIGDFTFSVKENLTEFRPENLAYEGYWKKTQIDYIATCRESGTKKSRQSRLSYLNSYLFDYLPSFFKKHSATTILKYPENPKDFLSYVFVSSSETLAENQFGEKKNTIYPVSILDYVYTITEEKALAQGYSRTNAGRDTVATIQQYFDFVITKFSAIPECSLVTNPITHFDKDNRKGYGYHKSQKEKIDLDYWVLLRMYLLEVSKAALLNAERVVFHGKDNQPIFTINKTIEWLEHNVHIDTFDATNFQLFTAEDWKEPTKFTEYQGLVTLTLLAWSGLRDSNILWLDVKSYSQHCPSDYSDDDYVPLWVNTDKAKTEPYISEIFGHAMRLLDRSSKLRMRVNRAGFNEPIPYKGANNSKWPDIRPLLQKTQKNASVFKSTFLLDVLLEFEKCLTKHNRKMRELGQPIIEFTSSIYYLPQQANQANFRSVRSYVHAEQDYSALLRHLATGESYQFTPIKQAVIWTPHSMRVTFDSVCSVLADPTTVGQVATGQHPKTVGYYSINTLDEAARIKAIHAASGLKKQFHPLILQRDPNFCSQMKTASISDVYLDEEKYLRSHALGTASMDFNCHSLSAITVDGIKPPIEVLIHASSNEIAFNRTHICPFNNNCPKEVIAALLGEKCCAICPYAIISTDHAVAISSELKRLGDIASDITRTLKNARGLLKSEKEQLKNDRALTIKSISGWLVRHKFLSKDINSQDYFTGRKNDMLMKHMSSSFSGQNLITRLIESDGVSTMTSAKLEREATRLNRKLTALMNRQPEILENLEKHSASESEIAIHLIKTICELNKINETQLANRLTSLQPTSPMLEWISEL
ncbi:hypothetical protein ACIMS2_005003 [Vibrio harveyi]